MTKQVQWFWATIAFVLLAAAHLHGPAFAQTSEALRPLPIDDWLGGPERQDFPWKIHLFAPRLTFQQRYLVQVRANIDTRVLQNAAPGADLHLLVKVSDDRGHWLSGENYNHFSVPPDLNDETEIEFDSGLYLRPGSYSIAVIAYDSVSGSGNLWRRPLRLQPLKDDPLPQMDRALPRVEFLPAFPTQSFLPIATHLHSSPPPRY